MNPPHNSTPPAAGEAAHKPTRLPFPQEWEQQEAAFDKWFAKQKYSLGAVPNWTQQAEMKRVWCIATITERNRACNSHAVLVAALELAEKNLSHAHTHLLSLHSRNIDRSGTTNSLCDSTLEAAEQARSILSAAKS